MTDDKLVKEHTIDEWMGVVQDMVRELGGRFTEPDDDCDGELVS